MCVIKMLKNLIENLEKFEYRLIKIRNESSLTYNILQKERFRSISSMVNILSSLVNKTTYGKNCEEDIVTGREDNMCNESQCVTLINPEEFLNEAEKLQASTPTPDTFNNYLLSFYELLGDIIFSTCQISSCKMKLKSGILVKDLVNIKKTYLSIWDLLSSMFSNTSDGCNQTTRNQSCKNKPEIECIISDLIKSLQLCLKDMVKVKMEIEHLIKFNMIEIKFNNDDVESEFNIHNESGLKNEKTFKSDRTNISFANPIDENFNLNITTKFPPQRVFRTSSSMFNSLPKQCDIEDQYLGPYLFPPKMANWEGYDCKVIEDKCGSFFNPQIICPPEVLFFDPTTLLIQSTLEPSQKHSLPKIYSVDSITEKNLDQLNCTKVKLTEETMEYMMNNNNSVQKKENKENKLLLELPQEDLFSESFDKKESDTEFIKLKEKISSLFSMLKTKKIDCDEDIFHEVFKKPEKTDFTQSKQQPFENSDTKMKKKKGLREKFENKYNKLILKSKSKGKGQSDIHSDQMKQPQKQDRCNIENSNSQAQKKLDFQHQFPLFYKPDGDFGEKPIIQLYKTDKKDCLNSNSSPIEESKSAMWPVSAAYIYVSKERTPLKCHSTLSSNSFSLPNSFEKSLFSIQMNKKYEQNHFYDGDLIVLDHIRDLPNERSSSCSLFNQSCVIYDDEQQHQVEPKINAISHYCNDNYYEKLKHQKHQMVTYDDKITEPDKKDPLTQQQTYAVQYANCEDSFMINNNFKRNKLDFLNVNTFSGTPNWDSFISIVTSKSIGPTTKINERRMFRKIVNNIVPSPFQRSNIFTNVQTLTSNGGPFRLFDVNGYPLTDSAGNVLKDPYGKCVVELDSTGFPRDDMQVFDAAGNSPKEVNFDPTQKPKTNSIIVKLTDNFRRPLHLFDKYDRPLTDSNGKLLVNIHGRPLLRFDNFGRPNTDYRGGPLYTDNGLRWSYKNGQSLSKEDVSTETLTEKKINDPSEHESKENLCSSSIQAEGQLSMGGHIFGNNSSINYKDYVDNRASDIWLQVEKVLQQLPKKNIVDTKPCKDKTHLIVNSLMVPLQNTPFGKENLDSIISLHNVIKENPIKNKENKNVKRSMSSSFLQPKDLKNKKDIKLFLEKNLNHTSKEFLTCDCNEKVLFPLYNNVPIQNSCSKSFCYNKLYKNQKNTLPNIDLQKNGTDQENMFFNKSEIKNNIFSNSTGRPNNFVSTVSPFRNQEYLNNLCNTILKSTLDSKKIIKLKDNTLAHAATHFIKENFTDSSLSEFTSSLFSKYTNDVLPNTDSPAVTDELPRKDSQITKLLGEIDLKFKKHNINIPNNSCDKEKELRNDSLNKAYSFKTKEKYSKDIKKIENNVDSCIHPNSISTETAYTDITNHSNINKYKSLKERVRAGLGEETSTSNGYDNFISTDRNCKTNDSDYTSIEQELMKKSHSPTKNLITKHKIPNHPLRNEKPNKDSPFRFPSDGQMETTIAMNDDITYVNEKNWQITKNYPTKYISDPLVKNGAKYDKLHTHEMNDQQFFQKEDQKEFDINQKQAGNKYKNFERKPVKKATYNRDCNLVSFFGTPVKYVLNKLDNKLSMRHQNKSKNKHHHLSTDFDKREIKTIYSESRHYKNDLTSSENERIDNNSKRRGKHDCTRKGKVIAYRSKSFSELQNHKKMANMSYSGNESSDKYFEYLPECSSQYHRCSSDTVVLSQNKSDYILQKSQKYKNNLKNEQYSLETNYVKKGYPSHRHHHSSNKRSPTSSKRESGTNPKSNKNRSKHLKMFNKSETSNKKRRAR